VYIYGDRDREEVSTVKVSVVEAEAIPNPSGGIESVLMAQVLGMNSNNELSSAYSIRGGNFDENLVYVNDFEVYRPFLIRSGQQEGLSFVNGDLVDNITFSSGGFQAKYGDKMASVLAVEYKRPREFHGSFSASLLGGTAHIEGTNKNERFSYALGVRNKTSRYLLGSQDVKGQYSPAFVDVQTFLTYRITDRLHVEYIANYARNKFDFIPEDRSTDFGLVNFQTRFSVEYEGQENDSYQSFMNGLAFVHKPNRHLNIKWMASAYLIGEEEKFDIIGKYSLGEVETDPSKENAGEVKYELGAGTFHDWARNELYTQVYSAAHKGSWFSENHTVKWGLTYKREQIQDKISEWERIDSAGYSLPYSSQQVLLYDALKAEPFDLNSNRYSGYLQHTWHIGDSSRASINYGARFTYWDVNNEFLISPRMQLSFKPKTKKDLVFTAAAGMYQQPPFYREMRNLEGEVNLDLKAQKSAHFIVGVDYAFTAWKRPFRFTTEAYYKYLWDAVPYEFDNVLIRYFGENNSKGYVAGLDFRLHGELAKDAESWVSMSIMSTKEDVFNDFYTQYIIEKSKEEANGQTVSNVTDTLSSETVYPGYIARPTDQRVSFALFFQDYIPKFPYLKVHMSLLFATGLPFGPPDSERYQDEFRIPPYRRFDVGFSALLFDIEKKQEKGKTPKNFFKHMDKVWLSLEVYNLFGIQNTVSYYWVNGLDVRTGEVGQYAVPNYLTNRRVNLRLKVDF
ncbi:MAG: TonB-dependent receptor plug domain-containing protein, partial [Chitinophagales bacterium]